MGRYAAAARSAYDQFLVFDQQIKRLTTDWQLAAAGPRTEGFSAGDWKLVDRLIAVYEKAGAALGALGRAGPRFAGYRPGSAMLSSSSRRATPSGSAG